MPDKKSASKVMRIVVERKHRAPLWPRKRQRKIALPPPPAAPESSVGQGSEARATDEAEDAVKAAWAECRRLEHFGAPYWSTQRVEADRAVERAIESRQEGRIQALEALNDDLQGEVRAWIETGAKARTRIDSLSLALQEAREAIEVAARVVQNEVLLASTVGHGARLSDIAANLRALLEHQEEGRG